MEGTNQLVSTCNAQQASRWLLRSFWAEWLWLPLKLRIISGLKPRLPARAAQILRASPVMGYSAQFSRGRKLAFSVQFWRAATCLD